ncbi:MAG TPA: hypothetical protein VM366_12115 [Anaerolineae bacterium]|nr:hypothetical protein [Anaerolineae bacterium]
MGSMTIGADVDDLVAARTSIDPMHRAIHQGNAWMATHYDSSVAGSLTCDLLLVVGASNAHAIFSAASTGIARAILYEATTTSSVGTAMSEVAINRASVASPLATVTHTPTVTSVKTEIATELLPAGVGAPGMFGAVGHHEVILDAGKAYLFRIDNLGSTVAMSVGVRWYEIAGNAAS